MQKVMSIMSQADTVKISRGSTDRHLRLLVINRTNSSADSSANSTSITSSTSGSISSTPGNHIVRLNYRDYRDDRDGWITRMAGMIEMAGIVNPGIYYGCSCLG